MLELILASIVLIISGIYYDPISLLGKNSNFAKEAKNAKTMKEILGAAGLILSTLLFFSIIIHLIGQIQWLIVLFGAIILFVLGLMALRERISGLTSNRQVNKLLDFTQDINESLKSSFSSRILAIFIISVGIFALLFSIFGDWGAVVIAN